MTDFDEFLNADWCDHGPASQNECLICNVDLRQSIMDSAQLTDAEAAELQELRLAQAPSDTILIDISDIP